jgi:hypothetical protein
MTTTTAAQDLLTTHGAPPAFGTTIAEWEGYAFAREIVPGDVLVPGGLVTSTVRVGDHYEIATADESDLYAGDEAHYIVRKVKVTIEEA